MTTPNTTTTTTTSPATTAAEPSLPDLATRIRAGHSAVIEAKKNIVRKAIEVGGWLKQAKDSPEMKHGQWLPWLKANCPEISERTAQRYMELADNKEPLEEALKLKSAAMADLTLAGAVELLKSPELEAITPLLAKSKQPKTTTNTTPTNPQAAVEPPDSPSDEDVGKEWLEALAVDDLITWLKELHDDEYLRELSAALTKVLRPPTQATPPIAGVGRLLTPQPQKSV